MEKKEVKQEGINTWSGGGSELVIETTKISAKCLTNP